MLKADQIELAILNLIVDHVDVSGPTFQLAALEAAVSQATGLVVSQREIVDALLLLYDAAHIGIGRYSGGVFIPYDRQEDSEYFYYGYGFKCRSHPQARRRQQELSKNKRHGIFISHIAVEAPVALHIKALIHAVLSPAIPVFVSSDYDSIPSGEWYRAILNGLKQSEVILSLLSPTSCDRPWINFEAGFGLGQETEVIPIVWRGLGKGSIGMPLGQLQARALNDHDDVKALLHVLARICERSVNAQLLQGFMAGLPAVEAAVPSTELAVKVIRTKDSVLQISVQNKGTRQLELVDAELLIPQKLAGDNHFQEYQPVLQIRRINERDVKFVGRGLTTHPSTMTFLGISPLPQILTAEMGEYLISALSVRLPTNLSPEDAALPIRFAVQAKQTSLGPVMLSISDIPIADD